MDGKPGFLFGESGFIIMSMDSFNVFDKEAKENSGDVPKLGVKLESIEPVSDKAIMVHHENHHRPCPSCETQVGDGDGPRCSNSTITSGAYDVVVAAAVSGASVPGSGAVVRAVQPFDISTYSTPHTVSKFPGLGLFLFRVIAKVKLIPPWLLI